jgi:hypothetical protein
MADAGWYDDGSGRERWFDGAVWLDRYKDDEVGPDDDDVNDDDDDNDDDLGEPLRVFEGNGSGGSTELTVYPNFVEFEHNNYVVAIPKAKIGPVSYSKQQTSPYDAVAVTPDVDFHCDNPQEVYAYLRAYIART